MPDNSFEASSDLPSPNGSASPGPGSAVAPLTVIQEALHGLQYGQVTVIVQDGVVVQVERTEKRRLKPRSSATEP